MKHNGFTLVEMLVVVSIGVALIGISIPLGRTIQARSREAVCQGNLNSIALGLEGYLQDHNNHFPDMVSGRKTKTSTIPVLETELLPYLKSREVFKCPADKEEFAKTGSSYFWNSTQSNLNPDKAAFLGIVERPDKVPLVFDKEAWHPHGTNILYADYSSSSDIRFSSGH